MSEGPAKRRWFQFSLGALFVVATVFCCWLGYAVPLKNQRHAFLAKQDLTYEFNDTPPLVLNRWGNRLPVFAPRGLWLLGERGLVSVWLIPKIWSPEAQSEAERLFPEARIMKIERRNWVSARPAETSATP